MNRIAIAISLCRCVSDLAKRFNKPDLPVLGIYITIKLIRQTRQDWTISLRLQTGTSRVRPGHSSKTPIPAKDSIIPRSWVARSTRFQTIFETIRQMLETPLQGEKTIAFHAKVASPARAAGTVRGKRKRQKTSNL